MTHSDQLPPSAPLRLDQVFIPLPQAAKAWNDAFLGLSAASRSAFSYDENVANRALAQTLISPVLPRLVASLEAKLDDASPGLSARIREACKIAEHTTASRLQPVAGLPKNLRSAARAFVYWTAPNLVGSRLQALGIAPSHSALLASFDRHFMGTVPCPNCKTEAPAEFSNGQFTFECNACGHRYPRTRPCPCNHCMPRQIEIYNRFLLDLRKFDQTLLRECDLLIKRHHRPMPMPPTDSQMRKHAEGRIPKRLQHLLLLRPQSAEELIHLHLNSNHFRTAPALTLGMLLDLQAHHLVYMVFPPISDRALIDLVHMNTGLFAEDGGSAIQTPEALGALLYRLAQVSDDDLANGLNDGVLSVNVKGTSFSGNVICHQAALPGISLQRWKPLFILNPYFYSHREQGRQVFVGSTPNQSQLFTPAALPLGQLFIPLRQSASAWESALRGLANFVHAPTGQTEAKALERMLISRYLPGLLTSLSAQLDAGSPGLSVRVRQACWDAQTTARLLLRPVDDLPVQLRPVARVFAHWLDPELPLSRLIAMHIAPAGSTVNDPFDRQLQGTLPCPSCSTATLMELRATSITFDCKACGHRSPRAGLCPCPKCVLNLHNACNQFREQLKAFDQALLAECDQLAHKLRFTPPARQKMSKDADRFWYQLQPVHRDLISRHPKSADELIHLRLSSQEQAPDPLQALALIHDLEAHRLIYAVFPRISGRFLRPLVQMNTGLSSIDGSNRFRDPEILQAVLDCLGSLPDSDLANIAKSGAIGLHLNTPSLPHDVLCHPAGLPGISFQHWPPQYVLNPYFCD